MDMFFYIILFIVVIGVTGYFCCSKINKILAKVSLPTNGSFKSENDPAYYMAGQERYNRFNGLR